MGAALLISDKVSATILLSGDSTVTKSIYPIEMGTKSDWYNRLWGRHYRDLYCTPVRATIFTLNSFNGGVNVVTNADDFRGLVVEDKNQKLYLLRLLGGSTSFLESTFFREIYNRQDFKDTYLDSFIGDAYTLINPYTFLVADYMAKKASLDTNLSRIYYIPEGGAQDTITGGWKLEDRLVSVSELPDIHTKTNIMLTDEMLEKVKASPLDQINQVQYIRTRLFDMLVGDWNKIPENWNWEAEKEGDLTLFAPIVIDRNHAFSKVDGLLFQQMLGVLGLGFITDYDTGLKKLDKSNSLGFALDMALVGGCDESIWLDEAYFLQEKITDQVIDQALAQLPSEIAGQGIGELRNAIKERRALLPDIARKYIGLLEKTPVIAGTGENDHFVVDRHENGTTRVRIYSGEVEMLSYDHVFSKGRTKEIWIYGVGGSDRFDIRGRTDNTIPVYLISGSEENEYHFDNTKKLRVYGYPEEKDSLATHPKVWKYLTDSTNIHQYDYNKVKYHTNAFTPIGVYDSDYGASMALFYTYTMYGFKRSPFTYQHRIGYNFSRGFYYQGLFPGYNSRLLWKLDLFVGNPKNFQNFFGFGNETNGYKDEKNDYNRAYVNEYSLTPSFHYALTSEKKVSLALGLEARKANDKEERFITDYYSEDYRIFSTNYYADLRGTFEFTKSLSAFVPRVEASLAAGWNLNLSDTKMNFPYTVAKLSVDLQLADRLTYATQFVGKALYSNSYEFFQSASIELRGYRDNRFIGKQSFYQYSDFRLDMGKLENPFTPIKYGLFAGFDHGRVWYPGESSREWHVSYGGGFWLTFINKLTTKFSYFNSSDTFRFSMGLSLDF